MRRSARPCRRDARAQIWQGWDSATRISTACIDKDAICIVATRIDQVGAGDVVVGQSDEGVLRRIVARPAVGGQAVCGIFGKGCPSSSHVFTDADLFCGGGDGDIWRGVEKHRDFSQVPCSSIVADLMEY